MNYLMAVFPGLSGLLGEELSGRTGLHGQLLGRVRGSELVSVEARGDAGLLELRLAEDVFRRLAEVKLTGKPADLKNIAAALGKAAGLPARVKYRVVVQADDARWRGYRRVDMQRAAEAGLLRSHAGWRLSAQEAPVEIWLHQVGWTLHASLRLTTAEHRARGGREVERSAALRPTIAAAMVQASEPAENDVFLDPMCGTGTILLERALAGRHALLIGGDIDPAAVRATQENFGPRHKPVRIERMDARKLPLEDGSVDKLVTNLPWGRQIGDPAGLPALYAGVLAEAVRVVRPGGRVVLLTGEPGVLERAFKGNSNLKPIRVVAGIEVLGRPASMFVLERT